MSTEKQIVYRTTPLPVLLSIIFMVLKLCNVITWSWWWVFSPLWISAGLGIAVFLLFAIFAIVVMLAGDGY